MSYAILDPATQTARLVDVEIFEGLDVTGQTVIELPDDASWLGKAVDWDTLQIIDDIPQARASAWDRVKAIREEKLLLAPVPSVGIVQADPVSLGRITGLVVDAREAKDAGEDYAETFTLADNTEHLFTDPESMISFGRAVAAHIKAVMARGRELRHAIEAATTRTEVDAIDVETGWP